MDYMNILNYSCYCTATFCGNVSTKLNGKCDACAKTQLEPMTTEQLYSNYLQVEPILLAKIRESVCECNGEKIQKNKALLLLKTYNYFASNLFCFFHKAKWVRIVIEKCTEFHENNNMLVETIDKKPEYALGYELILKFKDFNSDNGDCNGDCIGDCNGDCIGDGNSDGNSDNILNNTKNEQFHVKVKKMIDDFAQDHIFARDEKNNIKYKYIKCLGDDSQKFAENEMVVIDI